jgi:hypothetical protein
MSRSRSTARGARVSSSRHAKRVARRVKRYENHARRQALARELPESAAKRERRWERFDLWWYT